LNHLSWVIVWCSPRVAINSNSPVSPLMRNARAVPLGQVATQQSADDCTRSAKDHEWDSSGNPACKVGKEEDRDSCIHQNRQHDS
jgi:hypothetical protein